MVSPSDKINDKGFMRRALELARKGEGRTSPNPMVGAVIVKNGKVVGEGWHKKAGGPHAEINAIRKAGANASGADLFVTLEPCRHYGKTPPCTDAVLQAGIKRVVVGMRDPNPLALGKGIRLLKKRGVEVVSGLLSKECAELNEAFVKFIRTGRPFVILKSALSLDGKIATRTGESQWITGARAREKVHVIRDRVDAILVGAGTVLKDNPYLTARLKKKNCKHPVRVILDSRCQVPLSANVFNNSAEERVIYATLSKIPDSRSKALEKKHVEVLRVNKKRQRMDLDHLMRLLGERQISSLLVEGGAEVNSRFIKDGLVDKAILFLAPILIGGREAPGMIGGRGIERLKDALKFKTITVTEIGPDLMLEGKV